MRVQSAERFALLRDELECESSESIRRAVWQLESADEAMASLRSREEWEAAACTAKDRELLDLRTQMAEECAASKRLAAELAAGADERKALQRRARALEEELRLERTSSREVLASASRERQEAITMMERFRNSTGLVAEAPVPGESGGGRSSRPVSGGEDSSRVASHAVGPLSPTAMGLRRREFSEPVVTSPRATGEVFSPGFGFAHRYRAGTGPRPGTPPQSASLAAAVASADATALPTLAEESVAEREVRLWASLEDPPRWPSGGRFESPRATATAATASATQDCSSSVARTSPRG